MLLLSGKNNFYIIFIYSSGTTEIQYLIFCFNLYPRLRDNNDVSGVLLVRNLFETAWNCRFCTFSCRNLLMTRLFSTMNTTDGKIRTTISIIQIYVLHIAVCVTNTFSRNVKEVPDSSCSA